MKWQKIFLFWLLSFPFVVWNQSYEAPKIIWLFLGSIGLCILWTLKLREKIPLVLKNYDLIYFLWLLILLISSIFGVHPIDSIIGGSYRHQGLIFFFALFIIGKTINLLEKKEKLTLIKWLGIEVVLEAILLIFRPLGTFGERNAAAGFLSITASLINKNIYLLFAFLGASISISRSAILSLVPNIFKINLKKGKFLMIVILIILTAVFVYANSLKPNLVGFENRELITKVAIAEIIERPLLGYGAESGEFVYDNYFIRNNTPLFGLLIDRAHNLVLDITLWSGILGLIPFVAWFILRSREIKKDKKIALFSWLIFSMFQPLGTVHWLLLIIIFDI